MLLGVYGEREWHQWLAARGIQLPNGNKLKKDVKVRYHSVDEYLNDLAKEAVWNDGIGVIKQALEHGGGHTPMFSLKERLDSSIVTSLLRMKSDNDRKLPQ